MFSSLPLVDVVYHRDRVPDAARAFTLHTMTLGWEERAKARARRRSDAGLEFGMALPRGTVLRNGDCLIVNTVRTIVEVIERAEPVFVIEPKDPVQWGLFAYHIGNGHQPLMITDRTLVCPDVPGAEMLLQYHRIPYVRTEAAFTPTTVFGHVSGEPQG